MESENLDDDDDGLLKRYTSCFSITNSNYTFLQSTHTLTLRVFVSACMGVGLLFIKFAKFLFTQTYFICLLGQTLSFFIFLFCVNFWIKKQRYKYNWTSPIWRRSRIDIAPSDIVDFKQYTFLTVVNHDVSRQNFVFIPITNVFSWKIEPNLFF